MRTRLLAATLAVLLAAGGTILLLSYVRGADARALAGQQPEAVLVVSAAVPAGTPGNQLGDYVTLEQVPAAFVVPGAVDSLDALGERVAVAELAVGEQVIEPRFVAPEDATAAGTVEVPEGMVTVSVSVEPQRALGGAVAAGDEVGVLISFTAVAEPVPTTHLQLNSVLVTAVAGAPATPSPDAEADAVTGPAATPVAVDNLMITLALPAADAEQLVFGAEFGSLWFSTQPDGTPVPGVRVVTPPQAYEPERNNP